MTDEELLSEFVDHREEVAFEALVHRHARRVLAVCRRVLGRSAEVEDAFQATFLVLARKAGTIRNRGLAGTLASRGRAPDCRPGTSGARLVGGGLENQAATVSVRPRRG